jgi:hypothetical protein
MKKRIALIMALVLMVSCLFVGCNKSPEAVVQEVVAEANKEIDSLKEAFADTMDIAITAKGTAVVYTYTYVVDIPDIDAVATALESSVDSQSAVFEGVVDALKSAGAKEGSVILEYLTKDGEMIYTKEYK